MARAVGLGVAHPRIIVPGSTVALSRRAVLRKAFLGDWDARVGEVWLYALADAQRVHDVAVHHGVRCVSHHHLEVTARGDGLPGFLHRLHRDLSCALNRLLAMEGYDAPRELWDGRPTHVMQLVDEPAQMRHLLYSRLNPVAAGLVRRPEEMPGRGLGFDDWLSDGVVVKRPAFYFGKNRPAELCLKLTPPLRLLAAFGGDRRALVYHLNRLVDEGVRAHRRARVDAGWGPVVGVRALKRMHPWAEPRTLAEAGGRRVPAFKVGVLGPEGRELRARCEGEVRAFREAYGDVRRRRIAGEDAAYPFGSYGPRAYYNAPVEPTCGPDALLTRPGPATLAEALGERGDGERTERRAAGRTARRDALLDMVRAAQAEEIGALGEEVRAAGEEVRAAGGARAEEERAAGEEVRAAGGAQRPEPETRHRLDPARGDADTSRHPRRLIIERDDRGDGGDRGDIGPPR